MTLGPKKSKKEKKPTKKSETTAEKQGLFSLEPRIVFDAAAPVALSEFAEGSAPDSTDASGQSNPVADIVAALEESELVEASSDRSEIVFIDSSAQNAEAHVTNINQNAEVVFLDPQTDGVLQIADVLSQRGEFDAIHIIAGGSESKLALGTAEFAPAELSPSHQTALESISGSLKNAANILIYGSEFGSGESGATALAKLGEFTGAGIAAGTVIDGGESETDVPVIVADVLATPSEYAGNTIVFVDQNLENVDQLTSLIDPSYEVVMIDGSSDGVEQIAFALDERTDLAAIHILSHGEEGRLFLGDAVLDSDSMRGDHADELSVIGAALSEDGDILIYGCDFTGGSEGLEAAILLGSMTRADIAASKDGTGHIGRGGDWELEDHVGDVDADGLAVTEWDGLLAPNITLVEDTPHTFTAADFDANNDWTEIKITSFSIPAGASLTLAGSAVAVNDTITRAQIDAGDLVFTPGTDGNGINYATIGFDAVPPAYTNADFLAGDNSSYTVGGVYFNGTNARIADTNLFGPTGTVSQSINVVGTTTTVNAAYLAQGDVYFDGWVPQGNYSTAELSAIETWVQDGGVMISTNDSSSYDGVSTHFGLTFGGTASATWTVADDTNPIMNGPFGAVGANGDPFSAAGSIGYFNPAALLPGDQVLAYNNGNASQPTIVMRQHGDGWILFMGDEGPFRAGLSSGTGMTTANDILVGNIFAWAIDQSAPQTISDSVSFDVTPVNDAPVAVDDTIEVIEDGTTTFNPLSNDSDAESDVYLTDFTHTSLGDVELEIGESDSIEVDSDGLTVELSGNYTNPVVFVFTTTENEDTGQPDIARVTNVTGNSFDLAIVEPNSGNNFDATDGVHGSETVSYMVLEAGIWTLADGTVVEVGTNEIGTNANAFTSVTFDHNFSSRPVVLSQIQTDNTGVEYNETRQRLVTANGYQITNEPADYQSAVDFSGTPESIGYLAIASGTGTWSGLDFEAGLTKNVVTHGQTSISFTNDLGPDVNFLGQQDTRDGGDNAHLDGRDLTGTGISVSIQEDRTSDGEVSHTTEVGGWLALGGSGVLTAASGTNYSIAAEDVSFAFTPELDDVNDVTRTFTYTVEDAEGLSDTATVELKITPEVDTVTDEVSTPEDTPTTFNVLTNDNFEGAVTLTNVTGASNGTVSFDSAGNITYTPNADFSGTETLTYTVTEDDVGTTETGTVEITVVAVADAPLIGYAFDGSDIVYAMDAANAFPTDKISVDMEFQRDNTTDNMSLLSYAVPGSNNEMLVWLSSSAISVYINGAGYSLPTAADTDLHRASFTYDASAGELKIYLDGELGITHSVTSGALDSGGGLTFGQEQDNVLNNFDFGQAFKGTLYSADIYNGILTDQQIADRSAGNGDTVSVDFSQMNNFEVQGDSLAAIPVFTRGEVTDPTTIVDFDATLEDNNTITLDLRSHLTDLDGSETLKTEVSNIPVGAVLSDGGGNTFTAAAGSTIVDVSAWSLEHIILTPVEHSDEDIKLEIRATAIETSNGDEISTTSDVIFIIKAVADKPDLVTADETIDQDTVIDLSDNITGELIDIDGSEKLSYRISNIPTGSTIQTSDGAGGLITLVPVAGVVNITETQRETLKFLPPSGFYGTITLDVTAVSTESATGDQVETATADSDVKQIVLTITNPPPVVVIPIADQSSADASAASLNISSSFNDPDGDTLTYSATGLPTGLSINSTTGVISGTIDNSASQSGPYAVVVTADDGEGGTVTDTFVWTVTNPAPTVTSATVDQNDADATAVSLDASAAFTDVDADTLTYSVTGLPTGLSMNTTTGVISGTLDNSASLSSPYTIEVTADDGEGGTVTDEFKWVVTNPGPKVTSATADQTDADDTAVSLNASSAFTDIDADTLTYSVTGLPAGLSIDASTGVISGTLDNSASVSSPYTVEVTADDGEGGTVTDEFKWFVTNPAPTVTTAIADQADADDTAVSLDASSAFTDIDADTLTYTVTGLPAGLGINPTTGVISGTLDNSASVSGPYTVVVTANDGEGGTVTDEFIWTVTNPAPTLTSPTADQTSADASSVSLSTAAAFTDADGDTLSYSATGLPAGLTINTTTGVISGTVDNSASASGPYSVVVTANDGEGGTVTDTFVWTITNPAPIVTTVIADQTSADATTVSLSTAATFSDSDGDTLTYSATGLPTGLSINTTTGVISGTIDNSASQSGPYTVVVTADDGEGGTVTDTFVWTVTNPGPVATADSATTAEDTLVSGDVSTNDSDIDGDNLTYTKTSDPSNGSVSFNANGTFSYTPAANFNGTDSFTYKVADGEGGTDTATVSITITAVNDAPEAGSVAAQTNDDGEAITPFTAPATDIEGDTLTYSAAGLPVGLTINSSTGEISGTIDNSASTSSPYTVEVTVSDGSLTDTVTFSWTVKNPAPEGENESFTTNEDTAVSGNVLTNDTDPDGDTLVVDTTLIEEPEHGTVTLAADGTFTYTPDANYSGDDKFTYQISDGEGGTTTAVTYITIDPVLDAPLIGYEFDGSDIIYAEDGANEFPTDQITIDVVYQRDNATDSRALMGYAVPGSNNELVIWPARTYVGVFINGSQYRFTVAADTEVHRFTVTYDSTSTTKNLNAYMDGVFLGTRNVSSGALSSGGALIFGQEQDAVLTNFDSAQSFKGTLYSANIHSTALTDQQVVDNSAGNGDTVSIDFSRINNFEVVGDPASTFSVFTRGEVANATTIKTFDATLEDTNTITMDLRSQLVDTDGSEALETVVSNIPVGASITDGAGNSFTATAGNTKVDVSSWALENVILIPVENSDADITLTINATSKEGATSDTASVTSDVTFIIKAVADKPSLATSDETIAQDTVIDLSDNLTGTLVDTDGSETLSYQISNIPTGSIVQVSDGAGGTVTLVPIAGAVTLSETQRATLQFLPPNGFLGTITLDVKAVATEGATGDQVDAATSDSDVEQIVLTIVNTPPTVSAPIADRSDADAAVISLDTSSAFTDPDGHTLTYSVTGLPTGLSINPTTGEISGTIDNSASQSGPYTVVVTADDGKGGTVTDTFIWTVTNPGPTAVADSYTINEDTVLTGNVLSNDTDPDGDDLSGYVGLVTGPTNGAVSLANDGTFTYTPNPDFNGTDSFTYKISDGEGGTDEGTVSITVDAVADAPLIGYEYSGGEILYAVDSASAFPTEKVTIDLVFQRDNTTTDMGMFSYAVPGQANEVLVFQNGSVVDVWVGGSNHFFTLPATTDVQHLTVTFDGTAATDNVILYSNGVYVGGAQIAATSVTAGGSIALGHEQDGHLSAFEEHQEFIGTFFSANVYDGIIDIADINDGSAGPGDVVALDFSKMNNTTVKGDTSSSIDEFTRGSVIYPDTIVPYEPTVEDFNTIILDLRTTMQSAYSTETVSTVVSAIPVGASISDGTGNTFTATTGTTSVDVSTWEMENIVLTPVADDDSDITLVIMSTAEEPSNGDAASAESYVTFMIKADADAPTLTTSDETSVQNSVIDLSDNISGALTDTDGSESLSYTISNIMTGSVLTVSDGAGGTTTLTPTAGEVTITEALRATLKYTPPPGLLGTMTLYVVATATEGASGEQVDDKTADSVKEKIVLTITNAIPVVTSPIADRADADAETVSLDTSTSFTDPDGGTLTFSASNLPAGLTINATTGVISGTIDNSASQAGPYTVIITATDNNGGAVTDAFTWTVDNPAPTVTAATADQSGADADSISLNASIAFTDVDADTLTYSVAGLPAGLSIDASTGIISGTIDSSASQSGPYTVVVTADDGEGGTVTDEFNWIITNPAPTVTSAIADQTSADATAVTLNASTAFTDVDSDTLTYSVSGLPTGLSINTSTGIISGTLDNSASQSGPYTVVVTADDGEGGTVTDEFNWVVTNPAPTVTSATADQTSADASIVSLNASTAFTDVDADTLTFSATGLPTGLSIDTATGIISGTVDGSASQSGPFTVVVTANDGEGGTVTDEFIWTITNPAPTVTSPTADQTSVDATSVTLDTSPAFTDADGDTLTYSVIGLPAGLTIDTSTGVISGTIDNSASVSGPYTIVVTADDGEGGAVTDEFIWTITNPAPTVTAAVADQTSSDADSISLNTSTAFTDVDADTLTYSVAGLPAGLSIDASTGVISGAMDNSASQSGPYTVVVTADDGEGGTVTDEFEWVVTNPAPTVTSATVDQTNADAATVSLNASAAFNDVDADTLTYSVTGLPAGLTIDASTGVISGTIDSSASVSGPYTVVVTADDGEGGAITDEFIWTINNPAPIASADSLITNEDTAVTGNVLSNDSDPDGDTLSANATLVVPPTNGGVSMATDGTFTYTPNANFHGTDTFTYEVSDGEGGTATEVATITVLPVNDGPVVTTPIADVTNTDGQTTTLATAGAFSDIDGDTLTYTATNLPTGLSIDASTGVISGTINSSASQSGPYSVNVTAIDGNGGSVTDSFVWTIKNPGPTAVADSLTTSEDVAVTGSVAGNDSDQDGDILTFTQTGPASNGNVSFNASGTFTYTPDADFNGTDTFTYQVSDGEGGIDTATVTITVTSVNDAPVLGTVSTQSAIDGQAIIPLPITSTDVDGDTVSYSATGLPTGLSIDATSGLITGTVDNSASAGAPYSVVVTVTDANGATDTITFDWEVSNPAPTPTGESFSTAEDTAVSGNVLTNDTDPDGDALTVSTTLVAQPTNGSVTIATDGTFTYTPNPNYHGNDSFTYQVSDGEGGVATATVTLTVTSVNDGPTIAVAIADQAHLDNQAVSVATADSFADADGDTLTYSVTGLPTGLTIDAATGIISGTIDNSASQSGPYSVTVTAVDGNGGTVSDTFEWEVTNPAPTVNAALPNQSHSDSQPIALPTAGAFGDPDGDTLTYTVSGLPAGLSINASTGVISGTLAGNASQGGPYSNGNYSITVKVNDGEGGVTTDKFTWSVSNVPPSNGTPLPDVTYNDAESVSINAASAFNNADNDTLNYSATGLPAGLSIDTASGIISGTLDNSQSQLPNALIIVTVSDGQGGTATDTFLITVNNPAPTVINPIPDQISNDDQAITLNVATSFNDIDSDDLTFVANGLPLGLVIDASTGIISGTIDNSASQSGPYNITITANDGETGLVSDTFTWTINNPAPVVDAAIVDQVGEDSDVVSIDVTGAFTDADADTLTYSATGLPAGLAIDPSTGVLTGTIDADASGNGPSNNGIYSVTITADDGEGGSVSDTFTWTVTNVAPSVVDPLANQTHSDQQTVSINAAGAFTDGDGDPLTYSATGLPAGLSINATTGVIFGTIDNSASTASNYTVVVTAGDGTADITDTFTWTVTNPAPEVVVGTVDQSSADGDTISVAAGAAFNDPDNDTLTYSVVGLPAGLAMNTSTGFITGTIDNSASLSSPYTITVTADDGEGGTVTDTFVWSISNPAPIAANDTNATSEDTAVSGNVLANDNDPDSDDLTSAPTLVAEPANGTVSLAANGTYTYTPDADFNGTDSFTYSVSDGEGGTDTATVTITVSAVNDAPIVSSALSNQLNDDSETVTVDVTGAFSDVEGDTLTYTSTGLPAGLTLDGATGIISGTVDHSASVNSPYTVTIEASDGNGGAVATSFSWGVTNPGPEAMDDSASTTEDTAVSGNLLDNDSDPDGDTIVALATPVSLPTNGTVSISGDGSYTYTPNANFNGTDTFTYRITDNEGGTSDATVTITVSAENDRPDVVVEIADQNYYEADNVSQNVSGNFSDLDGDTLTYSATGLPPGLSINTTTGVISGTITSDAALTGPYTTVVTAMDGSGSSISDSFNFGVTNRNPVVDSQMPDITANDTDVISVDGASYFVDVDGDVLTYSATGLPAGLSIDPATGQISGTLPGDASIGGADGDGRYEITVTVDDGQGGTATDTFVVQAENIDPTVSSPIGPLSSQDGNNITIDVTNNFANPDNDALTFTATGLPAGLSLDPNSGLISGVIDSDASQNGSPYSVEISVDDGQGGTASQTFNWTITNPAPIVSSLLPDRTGHDAEPVSIDVVNSFVDPDVDTMTFSVSGLPSGTSFDPVTGVISGIIDHSASMTSPYTITITADDGQGGSVSQSFVWTIENIQPTAESSTIESVEDAVVSGTVVPLIGDVDGDNLTTTLHTAPTNGSVTVNPDGTFTYTPNADYFGTDSFVYQVDDGEGGIETAIITFNISAENDAPVTSGTLTDVSLLDAQSGVSIPTASVFTDIDQDVLTYSAANLPDGLSIDPSTGEITGTVDGSASVTGSYPVIITAEDGNGGVVTTSFTIDVDNVAPIAENGDAIVLEDGAVEVAVLDNVQSPDGDTLTVTSASAPNGVVTINPDGTVTYTPNENFNGIDTITYTVSDGEGGTSTATVAVTVEAVNDGPQTTGEIGTFDLTDGQSGINIPLSGAFTDIDGDTLTYAAANLPAGLTIDPSTGVISGTVDNSASQSGPYTIVITVDDGNGGTVTSEFVINVTNVGPVAVSDVNATSEDTAVSGNVLSNDSDLDDDGIAVVTGLTTDPANGSVILAENGLYTYTPDDDFNGTDSFSYTIIDGDGATAEASVTIVVSPVNDPPVLSSTVENQTGTIGTDVTVDVSGSFTDIDSGSLTFAAVGLPPGLTLDPATGEITGSISPSASTDAPYVVTITVSDGHGGSVTTQFTWDVINRGPEGEDQSITTAEDGPISGNILDTATDADGDQLVVVTVPVNPPAHGTVHVNLDGSFNYTPDENYNGTDEFTYQVLDNRGGATEVTVSVVITAVNDAPEVVSSQDEVSTTEGEGVTISVGEHFVDVDKGSVLTFSASGLPPGLTIDSATGVITGSPELNASGNGPYTVTIFVSDGEGGFSSLSFVIDVAPSVQGYFEGNGNGAGYWDSQSGSDYFDSNLANGSFAYGGSDGNGSGVILDTVNSIRQLGTTFEIHSTHIISKTVSDIEHLQVLLNNASKEFGDKIGHWDVKTLAGFSLKSEVLALDGDSNTVNAGEILVEGLQFEKVLYLQITDLLPKNENSDGPRYNVTLPGDKPLPHWIDFSSDGLILIHKPADVENLVLSIKVLVSSNESVEQLITVDILNAKVALLGADGEEYKVQSTDAMGSTFENQTEEEVSALEDKKLFQALFE